MADFDVQQYKDLAEAVQALSTSAKNLTTLGKGADTLIKGMKEASRGAVTPMGGVAKAVKGIIDPLKGKNTFYTFAKNMGTLAVNAANAKDPLAGVARSITRISAALQGAQSLNTFFKGVNTQRMGNLEAKFAPLAKAIGSANRAFVNLGKNATFASFLNGSLANSIANVTMQFQMMNSQITQFNAIRPVKTVNVNLRTPAAGGSTTTTGGAAAGAGAEAAKATSRLQHANNVLHQMGNILGRVLRTTLRLAATFYFLSYLIKSVGFAVSRLVSPFVRLGVAIVQSTEDMQKSAVVLRTRFRDAYREIMYGARQAANALGADLKSVLEDIVVLTNSMRAQKAILGPGGIVNTEAITDIVRMLQVIKMTQPDIAARFGMSFPNMLSGDARSFGMGLEMSPEEAEKGARRYREIRMKEAREELEALEKASDGSAMNMAKIVAARKRLAELSSKPIFTSRDYRAGKDTLEFIQQTLETLVDKQAFETFAGMVEASFNRIKSAFFVMMAGIGGAGMYEAIRTRIKGIADMLQALSESQVSIKIGTVIGTAVETLLDRAEEIGRSLFVGVSKDKSPAENVETIFDNLKAAMKQVYGDVASGISGALSALGFNEFSRKVFEISESVGIIANILMLLTDIFSVFIEVVRTIANILLAWNTKVASVVQENPIKGLALTPTAPLGVAYGFYKRWTSTHDATEEGMTEMLGKVAKDRGLADPGVGYRNFARWMGRDLTQANFDSFSRELDPAFRDRFGSMDDWNNFKNNNMELWLALKEAAGWKLGKLEDEFGEQGRASTKRSLDDAFNRFFDRAAAAGSSAGLNLLEATGRAYADNPNAALDAAPFTRDWLRAGRSGGASQAHKFMPGADAGSSEELSQRVYAAFMEGLNTPAADSASSVLTPEQFRAREKAVLDEFIAKVAGYNEQAGALFGTAPWSFAAQRTAMTNKMEGTVDIGLRITWLGPDGRPIGQQENARVGKVPLQGSAFEGSPEAELLLSPPVRMAY